MRRDIKNWWYYYKWYVICGCIVLGILIYLIGSKLNLWEKVPDYQIAYVGKNALPEDTVAAIEAAFASVSEDYNKDGEVIVKLNQYATNADNTADDAMAYQYASEIALIGDISDCDSYFLLLEDPADFQKEYHILANADGSEPENADLSVEDKVVSIENTEIYSLTRGTYSTVILGQEVIGNNADLLEGLYLGIRCFSTEDTSANADACYALWNNLKSGALSH